ncbi:MAG: hypothetical protein LBU76_00450 [Azoarcus sp.]|nr:hypothetical protein [Azoarcus sp.]
MTMQKPSRVAAPAHAPGAQFAEPGSPPPDAIAAATGRLMRESAPSIEGWARTVEAMLDSASSLGEFREMLLAAFPKLDSGALAETLAGAFAALDLRGRSDVIDEAAE